MYSQNFPKFKEFFESHCFQRTYYFHIFKCDFSDSYSCPYHDALVGSTINQFPDPIPYSDPSGVEHCEEGKYLKKFLPSKLIDIIKRKSIVSFSKIGQEFYFAVRCVGFSWPRLMYAQRKASTAELKTLKRLLNSFQCIWGTALQESIVNENSLEHIVLEKGFAREILSCTANMETLRLVFTVVDEAVWNQII